MTLTRRRLLATTPLLVAPGIARAFPTRPIRLVVSSAPAASLDTLARVVAPALSARLGQPVVVENEGAASGLLAMQRVARARFRHSPGCRRRVRRDASRRSAPHALPG